MSFSMSPKSGEEYISIVKFYQTKCNDLEFSNLILQLQNITYTKNNETILNEKINLENSLELVNKERDSMAYKIKQLESSLNKYNSAKKIKKTN